MDDSYLAVWALEACSNGKLDPGMESIIMSYTLRYLRLGSTDNFGLQMQVVYGERLKRHTKDPYIQAYREKIE